MSKKRLGLINLRQNRRHTFLRELVLENSTGVLFVLEQKHPSRAKIEYPERGVGHPGDERKVNVIVVSATLFDYVMQLLDRHRDQGCCRGKEKKRRRGKKAGKQEVKARKLG